MRRQVNGTCVKRWKEQSARNGAKRNEKRECTNACARQGWGEGGGLEGEGNSEKRGKPVEISRRKGEGRQIGTRSASVRFVSPYGRWIWRQGNEGRKRVSSWESSFFFEKISKFLEPILIVVDERFLFLVYANEILDSDKSSSGWTIQFALLVRNFTSISWHLGLIQIRK